LLHTPLKRARLPITPPELDFQKAWSLNDLKFEISNLKYASCYLLAGALAAGAAFAGEFAAGAVFAAGAELALAAEFAFASGAVLALASAGAVFAFASVLAGASTGVSGLLERTETLPVRAGIDKNNAESMNVVAATIVILERTVAVPRGARAELETLLVNNAPASVFPGCSRTAATRTRHERKKSAYRT
jgi:Na+-transporting methylmalonyl-CoA/oxaloacetate decarboxylase gamma subunit